jgi:hypothetical protein
MLGTGETIIVEVQVNSTLDRLWTAVVNVDMNWDDFKQMINNYLKEREDDSNYAQ